MICVISYVVTNVIFPTSLLSTETVLLVDFFFLTCNRPLVWPIV